MKTVKMNKVTQIVCLALLVSAAFSCKEANSQNMETPGQEEAQKPDTDLPTAVLYGNLEVVKQHIAAGTNLNAKDPMSGSTPLITAATFDQTPIALALVDAGADLSAKNNDGATALHVAAFFGRVEIVQKLLDAGADKNVRNNYGSTPLESVAGPFEEVQPIYELMQAQLGPFGLQLDMAELEKSRPVIAMMLQ